MSTAQILEEIKSYPTSEIETLEHELRLERLRRTRRGRSASAEETRLFEIINRPMPGGELYAFLIDKWQDEGLTEEERAELLPLVTEREGCNVERVEAVQRLSELRGVPFMELWKQIMGETPAPIVPKN